MPVNPMESPKVEKGVYYDEQGNKCERLVWDSPESELITPKSLGDNPESSDPMASLKDGLFMESLEQLC